MWIYTGQITVEWSDTDRCYVGTTREIPYCTAHGNTLIGTVAELQVALEAHMESDRREDLFRKVQAEE